MRLPLLLMVTLAAAPTAADAQAEALAQATPQATPQAAPQAAPQADPLAGPAPVTEAMVLDYARAHAPTLAAARHRLVAARAGVTAAAPWPEPQLTVGASPLPISTRNGPVWATARLSQRIPWTDALDARRDVAVAGVSAAEAAQASAALAVEADAIIAYHRLGLSRAEAAINREMLAIARRLLRLTEERLGVDRARQGDVIRAQVEVARLETVAVDLEQHAITRQAELNAAIGRAPRAPVGPLPPVDPQPVAALDALLARIDDHPALAAHAARIDAARARLRGAETRGRPDLTAAVGYSLVGEPETAMPGADPGRDALSVQIGVSLPVWGRDAYAGERESAAAAVRAAEAARAAAEDVVAHRVVEQVVRAETALRRLRLHTETALPLAEQHLEVMSAAYAAGEVPFAGVLDAEQTREALAVAAARAAAELAIARAALTRAVGQPLRGDTPPPPDPGAPR